MTYSAPLPSSRLQRPHRNPVLRQFAGVAALHLAALAAVLAWALPGPSAAGVAAALMVWAALSLLAAVGLERAYTHPTLGLCNAVTHLRGTLAAAVAAAVAAGATAAAEPRVAWAVVALAGLALALDGLDGWLARRAGRTSAFGARFDVEVDAALALLLALFALAAGKAGLAVLILGLARYGFVAAGAALPWLRAPLPPSLRRKTVCVVQLGTLIALAAPPVAPPVSGALAWGAAALLLGSFATDVLWLHRRRRAAP